MTRTRTQTALTKLALMVASIHGELAFVEGLIATQVGTTAAVGISTDTGMPAALTRLQRRRQELVSNRDALYATLRQFDPEIAPENIGTNDEWRLRFGTRGLQVSALTVRYKSQLHLAGTATVTSETANAARLYSSRTRVARQLI